MKLKKALNTALKLASKLDLKVHFGSELLYTKNTIQLESPISAPWQLMNGSACRATLSSLLHEIGHYIVAPPQRRKMKDYGIPNLSYNEKNKKRKMRWDYEEVKAQMVEQKLEDFLGVKLTKRTYAKEYKLSLQKWWVSEGEVTTKTIINLIR
jgi:hypothetical protein